MIDRTLQETVRFYVAKADHYYDSPPFCELIFREIIQKSDIPMQISPFPGAFTGGFSIQ